MKRRQIGSLNVPAMGLGCMGMTLAYHRADPAQATATIHHALEVGENFFDTADMYASGRNETLLGKALAGRRDKAIIATKFGIVTWPALGLPRGLNGRPERAQRCLDASLKRLGTDHVDLFYLHRVDPKVPVEETVGAMAELVKAGKAREIGVSEAGADDLRKAHATHPIAALQSEWSLFSRDIESTSVPVARELGIAIVAYAPLGRGMLTGSAEATTKLGPLDYRRFLPRWRGTNLELNLAQVSTVRGLAAQLGVTPGQLALAWVLARGDDVIPIPGTSKPHRLDENLASIDVVIPDEILAKLDALAAAGARYCLRARWAPDTRLEQPEPVSDRTVERRPVTNRPQVGGFQDCNRHIPEVGGRMSRPPAPPERTQHETRGPGFPGPLDQM